MSTIEVNKIAPVSGGTNVTLGDSGDTFTIPSGVTMTNNGTSSGFGATLTGSTDNTVVTVTGANAMQGESNLTWNGSSLGVGLASPETTAHIQSASGECELRLTAASTSDARLRFGDTTTTAGGYIGYNRSTGYMYVRAANSGSATMTLNSSGDIMVGKTNTNFNADGGMITEGGEQIKLTRSGNDEVAFATNYINCNGTAVAFHYSGSTVGTITTTHAATSYNTSSDYRLKENKEDITDGIERLKQLKPYRFNWKNDPNEVKVKVDGFFAHEVSPVVPEAITGEKDATETYTDDNGEEQTRIKSQSIDQSKLVPLLTSALKEAITKIETLEAKVAALESA